MLPTKGGLAGYGRWFSSGQAGGSVVGTIGHLESLVRSSGLIVYGRFSADGVLKEASLRLSGIVGPRPGSVRLDELLVRGQEQDILRLFADREICVSPRHLHFRNGDEPPITMATRWEWDGDDLLLLGEPNVDDLETTQVMLMQLNNKNSELARDNAKKSAELQKLLDDSRDSHWHLEQLQELLPICSYCGKVKNSTGLWQSLESYLQESSDFLTHGICPACAEQARTEMRKEATADGAAGPAHD